MVHVADDADVNNEHARDIADGDDNDDNRDYAPDGCHVAWGSPDAPQVSPIHHYC